MKKFYFKWCQTLLILIFTIGVSTTAIYASTRFDLQPKEYTFKNTTLKSAIEEILKGTSYDVIYNSEDIDNTKIINIAIGKTTAEKALERVLAENGLTFLIKDNNVVISKREAPVKSTQQMTFELKGKVVESATKKPISGATIILQGTTKGAISDEGGNFLISVKSGDKLEITYVGMKEVIYNVTSNSKNILIDMITDAVGIEDVVVTGYQRTTKNRMTGSVEVINSEKLKGAPLQSIDMLLQGKMAGVNVQAVSGKPGETAKIRIRGTNTMTGNAEPLWVIDGVMIQKDIPSISSSQIKNNDFSTIFSNGIAGINPNDIESITVLKDASAAAIYGSRAASGVIVVTTKKGSEGDTKISYSGNVSLVTRPVGEIELMNSSEKLRWEDELWNEFSNAKFISGDSYPVIGITGMVRSGYGQFKGMSVFEQDAYLKSLEKNKTNWLDEIFRQSISHSHNISITGGSKKSDYYVSMGYSKNNGLIKNNDYDRLNLSAKVGLNLHKNFSLDFNTTISHQKSKDASASVNLLDYAFFTNPYEKPYNDDGSYAHDNTFFELVRANGDDNVIIPDNGINILRELNETSNVAKNFSMSQIVSLNWNIYDNLRFEGIGSVQYTTNNNDNINGANSYAAFRDRPFEGNNIKSQRKYGSIAQNSSYNSSYSLRGQFSYNKDLGGEHHISALLGSEVRSQYSKSIYEKRYGYDIVTGNSSIPTLPSPVDGKLEYNDLIAYAQIIDGLSGQLIDESAVASFYFSTDYSYSNRYTLSFTARTDGSNNFGHNQQFNPIWSVGGLWNIRNEKFLESNLKWLSRLSLRLSSGYTGNINKNVYPQFIMNYASSFRKLSNEFLRMGSVNSAPNPNLRWERTFDYKVGLDIGILKNALSFQLEYYDRISSNVVTDTKVPYTTGFSTQKYNTSKIRNNGVELSVNARLIQKNDYGISISANGSYNRNILLEYISPTGLIYGSYFKGYPLNSIFGGKYAGIDPFTGVYTFDGRSDAKFESKQDYLDPDNYKYYLGTSSAPLTGGYNLNGRYKQLSVSIGGTYSIGGKILSNIKSPVSYSNLNKPSVGGESVPTSRNDLYVNHLNVPKEAANRWTENNKTTTGYPRLIDYYSPSKNYETYVTASSIINNGAFLENVSYFKINSISLSYNLSEKIVKKMKISSLGFSFIMNNILIITNYSGIDPEIPGAIYPQSKSFSLGVSLGF